MIIYKNELKKTKIIMKWMKMQKLNEIMGKMEKNKKWNIKKKKITNEI